MNVERLIAILADGEFHSGASLGQQLGISRTAVWKQVNYLENLGLRVNSVKGKGYRMTGGLEVLSGTLIQRQMNAASSKVFSQIEVKSSVASTNDEAKLNASGDLPYVCIAEWQTAGRGRRGREWVSPYGANVYMSLAWTFSEVAGSLDGLSLCVGIAVARAIGAVGIAGVGLKWPNDLVVEQKKVAGILLELTGELSGPIRVIIGIGVNVSMDKVQGEAIDQDWTSLSRIAARKVSRNQLCAYILNELAEALPRFQNRGFADFVEQWNAMDILSGNEVVLHLADKQVAGVAKGVASSGALLIEGASGIEQYRGGEVSVRVAK